MWDKVFNQSQINQVWWGRNILSLQLLYKPFNNNILNSIQKSLKCSQGQGPDAVSLRRFVWIVSHCGVIISVSLASCNIMMIAVSEHCEVINVSYASYTISIMAGKHHEVIIVSYIYGLLQNRNIVRLSWGMYCILYWQNQTKSTILYNISKYYYINCKDWNYLVQISTIMLRNVILVL